MRRGVVVDVLPTENAISATISIHSVSLSVPADEARESGDNREKLKKKAALAAKRASQEVGLFDAGRMGTKIALGLGA